MWTWQTDAWVVYLYIKSSLRVRPLRPDCGHEFCFLPSTVHDQNDDRERAALGSTAPAEATPGRLQSCVARACENPL